MHFDELKKHFSPIDTFEHFCSLLFSAIFFLLFFMQLDDRQTVNWSWFFFKVVIYTFLRCDNIFEMCISFLTIYLFVVKFCSIHGGRGRRNPEPIGVSNWKLICATQNLSIMTSLSSRSNCFFFLHCQIALNFMTHPKR